jgi:hypothetical protein
LPPVQPAVDLYTLLFTHGRPRPGQSPPSAERVGELVAWLNPPHREPARTVLRNGDWLAQEAVGLDVLAGR